MMEKFIWIILLCGTVFLLGFNDVIASITRERDNPDAEPCPERWLRIHRGCYMFVLSYVSWDSALAECKAQHGDLLVIQSEKEKNEIEAYIKVTALAEKHWWVGLKKEAGEWKWLSGGQVSHHVTPWLNQQKKNNPRNNCGTLDMSTRSLTISSDKCQSELQFICEFHSITNRPSAANTTPATPSRGATIVDEDVATGVGDHTAEIGDIVGVQKTPGQKTSVTVTNRPSTANTTPATPSRGATIVDEDLARGVGDHTAEIGDIVGVQKTPGQKTSVTGGLFSSVMAVLSKKDAHTSPRVEPSKNNGVDSKASTTVGNSEAVTESSAAKEHVTEYNGHDKTSVSDKNDGSSQPKTEANLPSTTEKSLASKTETSSASKSEVSPASKSEIASQFTTKTYSESKTETSSPPATEKYASSKTETYSASTKEKSLAPTDTRGSTTAVQGDVFINDESTTVSRSQSASSLEPTIPASTDPPRVQPDTPQPTMMDWVQAYSNFGGCYIPGTGGSLAAAVMAARRFYADGQTSCPNVHIGGIEWKNETAGRNASMKCAKSEGFATFHCGSSPVCWRGRPDTTGCASQQLQDVMKKVEMLGSDRNLTPMSVNETVQLSSDLARVVENEATTMDDVILTADVITALSKMKATEESWGKTRAEMLMENVVKTGSILVSKSTMWKAMSSEDKVQSVSLLLVALESAMVSIADDFDEPIVITKNDSNIDVEIRVVDVEKLDGETSHLVYGSEQSDNTFSIPVETLRRFSKGRLIKAVFITHYSMADIWNKRSKKRPLQGHPNGQNLTGVTPVETAAGLENGNVGKATDREIVSHILSASLGKDKHSHLKLPKPVLFTMKHLEEVDAKYTPLCSFWDIRHNKEFGFWSQEGCHVERTNKTHTTCKCDHMTNFAILMDVHGMEMSEIHESLLRLVSIIGCIISCVSLLASWITFQFLTSLQGERNSIHKNLAMTLLIAEMLFVFGIDQARHQIACSVIAGFLHFFFLAAFVWMFIEGLHIIFMLVQVFDASRSRLPYYYLAGYGVPLAVVGVSCLVNYKGYGTDKYCWLTTDDYFVWAFAGPVAIILLVNAIFLTYALSTVCRHSEYVFNAKESKNNSGIRAWVQGALALEVLLGLTWTLGYFLINDDSLPLAYVFAILNSLQGLFIFVFHCLLNKKAQKEYRQVVRKVAKRSASSVTTQSTLTKRTNHTNHSRELNNSPSNSHQKLDATNSHSQA